MDFVLCCKWASVQRLGQERGEYDRTVVAYASMTVRNIKSVSREAAAG
jgi:hypothetical protein